MSEHQTCPVCASGTLTDRDINHTATLSHEAVAYELSVIAPASVCSHCGAVFLDHRADDRLRRELRTRLGLLQPEEILHLREKHGLTQKDVSEATGIAEATLSRWENYHVVQSKSHDTCLRLFFKHEATLPVRVTENSMALNAPAWLSFCKPLDRTDPARDDPADGSEPQYALAA